MPTTADNKRRFMLDSFLKGLRVPRYAVTLIDTTWGDAAIETIRRNPFRLLAFNGVGFGKADTLRERYGMPPDNPSRVYHGIQEALSLAAQQNGHVCLPGNALVNKSLDLLGLQMRSKFIIEDQMRALDRDDATVTRDGMIYLQRFYRDELWIAEKIRSMLAHRCIPGTPSLDGLAEDQIIALKNSMEHSVCALTGAPGTGKSYTIAKIIESFPGASIALAAPTGKAAKRMIEMTGKSASTIHRLLEAKLDEETGAFYFSRDSDNPLDQKIIILDETSMIDNALFASFLRAIEDGTRLILVGDTNQLPPVGPGNVLHELLESGLIPCQELTLIKRQNPGLIITNCHRIKAGENIVVENKIENDFLFIEEQTEEGCRDEIIKLVSETLPHNFGVDPLRDVQILSPFREKSSLSCKGLNDVLQPIFCPNPMPGPRSIWRVGDKVIQTRNDYELDIINGDIGYIQNIYQNDSGKWQLEVEFESPKRVIEIPRGDNKLQHAYAVTCHKYQGSEQKIVIIPVHECFGDWFVQRNWIYTAISRASKLCVLVGQPSEIPKIIKRNQQRRRYTRLAKMLNGADEW